MSEQNAHPAALKPGEVPTINPWDLLDQAQAQERDLRAKLAAAEADLAKLSDPVAVRANILRGAIAIPDDLLWLHDTAGPVAELREKLAAAEAECGRLLARGNEECCTDYKTMLIEQRDAARRELPEALAILRTLGTMYPQNVTVNAFLARHERKERRKGERRKVKDDPRFLSNFRRSGDDRRKQPVDWQAREAELAQLRQWKKEAIEVDKQWDEVREHLRITHPMKIGHSYSKIVLGLLRKDAAREAVIQAAKQMLTPRGKSQYLYDLRDALKALDALKEA